METIATLHRMSRERLANILLSAESSQVAVIDVRDEDHVGGHVHSSIHVPSSSLDYRIPKIVRTLSDKKTVVFHCALSQQRGPSAALSYLRERDRVLKIQYDAYRESTEDKIDPAQESKEVEMADQGKEVDIVIKSTQSKKPGATNQEVFVLDGGFVKWQEKYAHCHDSLPFE